MVAKIRPLARKSGWFASLLKRVPGLQVEDHLCQEDWGVVVFARRAGKAFWVGLSAFNDKATRPPTLLINSNPVGKLTTNQSIKDAFDPWYLLGKIRLAEGRDAVRLGRPVEREDVEAVVLAFRRLVALVPRRGLLLVGADSPLARDLVPLAVSRVETFGTGRLPDERIQSAVTEVFDLRPAAIIRDLDLLRPIYCQTAAYGHFGRELPDFTWERTDKADELKSLVLG
jgi:hypothetical protein